MFASIGEIDEYFNSQSGALNANLRENRLERMKILLSYFSNPERNFKTVHIAGSKGKGTVATLLSSLLTKEGFKTGLYMSPHVYDIRERFTLSGEFFPVSLYLSVASFMVRSLSSFSFSEELGCPKPTTFELYTLYAYLLFYEANVDWAVIETGLGGRLDATNTLSPNLNIITHIEKEHTKILGSTLAEIAREKGGIITSDTPLVITELKDEAKKEIEEIAKNKNAFLYELGRDTKILSGTTFLQAMILDKKTEIILPYSSPTLREDAILSVLSLFVLGYKKSKYFDFSNLRIPARFEVIKKSGKTIILDGSHTPDSAYLLKKTLKENQYTSFDTLLISVAADKDIYSILGSLKLEPKLCILTPLDSFGKKSDFTGSLKKAESYYRGSKTEVLGFENPLSAFGKTAKGKDILVTGSFYLVSAFHAYLKEKEWH